ncbi:MAG: tetratricopeptide repeat protein, partial [Coleofasciculaceae cyanobacterium]
MPRRIRYLSLAIATLLFSLTPLLPVNWKFEPLVVQAQTTNGRKGASEIQIRSEPLDKSQFQEALVKLQQALVIYRAIGDHKNEAETLGQIGNTYFKAGQYSQVEELFRQKLESLRKVGDKESEQLVLEVMRRYLEQVWGFQAGFGIAESRDIFKRLGLRDISWQEQLEISQLNLFISREIADRKAQQHSLHSIGLVYRNLGRYSQALESYQKSLAIARERNIKDHEVFLLIEVGLVYNDISQNNKALKSLEQALSMLPSLKASGELVVPLLYLKPFAFNQIGLIYKKLKQYDRALVFFQQSLSELSFEGQNILNNIGLVYFEKGEYYQALKSYQQALNNAIPNTGDPSSPGFIINGIGLVNTQLGNYAQALEAYQKALAIFRELNAHPGERTTLSNIGSLLEKQNQPELAIVFYKEAVNLTEVIRQGLRELTLQEQQSYTQTVEKTYRDLAELLLKQDRVLEAQQVLDLLKLQELSDYLRNVRGNPQTQQGTEFLPQEQQLLTQYNAKLTQVVQLGKELEQLQKLPETSRTPSQETRRRQLETEQRQNKAEFLNFLRTPEVVALVQQLSRTTGGENLNPKTLTQLQDGLKQLKQDAVLLYPLILEDRLKLILVTPYAPPIRRTVPVKREELNRTIAEFRRTLTNPFSNASEPGQKLYNWLIKPLEPALKEAGARASIASLWTVDDGGTQVFMNAFYRALQTGKMTKTEALRQAQIALITGDKKALGE